MADRGLHAMAAHFTNNISMAIMQFRKKGSNSTIKEKEHQSTFLVNRKFYEQSCN